MCTVVSSDENSNQSSLSDMYQTKVDSSSNSSPQPSEPVSPAHVTDFRADDPQPPTLGQESLEGETRKDLAGLTDHMIGTDFLIYWICWFECLSYHTFKVKSYLFYVNSCAGPQSQ